MWSSPARVQLLPQPTLPQVPSGQPRSVARRSVRGALARGILPCRVYSASRDRPSGLTKPTSDLWDALPGCRRKLTDECGRSPTPRRQDRLPQCVAHLGPELASSSPCPLCRSRRRAVTGSKPVDLLPTGLLPARARARPPLSSQVLILPAGCL